MSEIILERSFDSPLTADDVGVMAIESGGCFALYNVVWRQSLLSTDGRRMLCHFVAPDAEALRNALRQTGGPMGRLSPVTIHQAAQPQAANVLVERSFSNPVELEEIQAIEDAGAWCLETHRVTFVRTFFSRDRKRMICLYRAPDAESVRLAQRQAQVPFDLVWSFQTFQPES